MPMKCHLTNNNNNNNDNNNNDDDSIDENQIELVNKLITDAPLITYKYRG
jgi:hypothetical protein